MPGLDGFGTKFYRMSGTNSTAVAGIRDLSGPDAEGNDIDITDMDSPNGFMEFLPGIVDAGEFEAEMIYDKAEANTLWGLFRTTGTYKVVFSDSSNFTFEGYLKSLGFEAPHDDGVEQSATWKISGKPTFATN